VTSQPSGPRLIPGEAGLTQKLAFGMSSWQECLMLYKNMKRNSDGAQASLIMFIV
jgi:hypothetical protein